MQTLRRHALGHESEFERVSLLAGSIDAGGQNRAISTASQLKNRFQQITKTGIPNAVQRWTDYVAEHADFEGWMNEWIYERMNE